MQSTHYFGTYWTYSITKNHNDPTWQAFVTKAALPFDKIDEVYQFYTQHSASQHHLEGIRFGCFSFVYPFRNTPVVRLHFENLTEEKVLDQFSLADRRAELQKLLSYIHHNHPEAKRVRGGSWLYNTEAYCSLFPPEFIRSLEPVGCETGFFALWGQFLKADKTVRQPVTSQFLACISEQNSLEDCMRCFPHQVLRPETPIKVFYDYYNRLR